MSEIINENINAGSENTEKYPEVIGVKNLIKTYANGAIEVQALKGINLTIRQS